MEKILFKSSQIKSNQIKIMQIIANTKSLNKLEKPIYLIFGNEPLLILETADLIRNKAVKQGFSYRKILTVIHNAFSWNELPAAVGSMSLFGDKTLVDLRIPNGKLGKDGSKEIVSWCNNINSYAKSALLLITMPELSWQDEKAAWFQSIDKVGEIFKVVAPKSEELPKWLAMRLQKYKLSTDEESLRYIAERVEGNLLAAHQEIQKLALIYADSENQISLNLEQIKAALVDVARYDLDDLRQIFLSGDLPKFSKILQNLLQEGEPLTLIVWAISEDVRSLYTLKNMQISSGENNFAVLFKKCNIWGIRQTWLKVALQKMQSEKSVNWIARLARALEVCAALDKKIKGADRFEQPILELLLRLALVLYKK